MKKYTLFVLIMLMFYACEQPQEILSDPPHRSRVPVPYGMTAQVDTLNGKTRVMLSWIIDTTGNFKKCDVYRSLNNYSAVYSYISNDPKVPYTTDLLILDNKVDSVIYYYAQVQGKDFFYGKKSDTLTVKLNKKK